MKHNADANKDVEVEVPQNQTLWTLKMTTITTRTVGGVGGAVYTYTIITLTLLSEYHFRLQIYNSWLEQMRYYYS
jgi:hypothetical protein